MKFLLAISLLLIGCASEKAPSLPQKPDASDSGVYTFVAVSELKDGSQANAPGDTPISGVYVLEQTSKGWKVLGKTTRKIFAFNEEAFEIKEEKRIGTLPSFRNKPTESQKFQRETGLSDDCWNVYRSCASHGPVKDFEWERRGFVVARLGSGKNLTFQVKSGDTGSRETDLIHEREQCRYRDWRCDNCQDEDLVALCGPSNSTRDGAVADVEAHYQVLGNLGPYVFVNLSDPSGRSQIQIGSTDGFAGPGEKLAMGVFNSLPKKAEVWEKFKADQAGSKPCSREGLPPCWLDDAYDDMRPLLVVPLWSLEKGKTTLRFRVTFGGELVHVSRGMRLSGFDGEVIAGSIVTDTIPPIYLPYLGDYPELSALGIQLTPKTVIRGISTARITASVLGNLKLNN